MRTLALGRRAVNFLAFDTSTDVLSIAVAAGDAVLEHRGEGGAKASSTLIPAVLDLLARAGLALPGLDAVVFGCGPGSFTGLRTACAVAQGLALGAGVPVLPVETLLAVAEDARARSGATRVLAVLDARMDQVYGAHYVHAQGRWLRDGAIRLSAPQDVQLPAGWVLAGNAVGAYGERLPAGERLAAEPTAAALLRVAPALLAAGAARSPDEALPLYVRDKVAQTTEERLAARAAAGTATIAR